MTVMRRLRARLYDVCEGSDLRRGGRKAELFSAMEGRTLFMAVGTGLDFKHFPVNADITAMDISAEMLSRAARRQKLYRGRLRLVRADAMNLPFADAAFDTAVTSCTLCSVPDPRRALREIHRVLRPGGTLLLFEHVRSRNVVFGLALDAMTLWTRLVGTEMNRDTLANVRRAGFEIRWIESVFLDIVLAVRAVKARGGQPIGMPPHLCSASPDSCVRRGDPIRGRSPTTCEHGSTERLAALGASGRRETEQWIPARTAPREPVLP
jgi:SAM-dependent methyltransferase